MSHITRSIVTLLIFSSTGWSQQQQQHQDSCYRVIQPCPEPPAATTSAAVGAIQGIPGKRGAKGARGMRGPRGEKGVKGDGIGELETRVVEAEQTLAELSTKLTRSIAQSEEKISSLNATLTNEMRKLKAEVFPPRFEFRQTPRGGTWQETRSMCQQLGGDLISLALKTDLKINHKPEIDGAVTKSLWIGISDIESEGSWVHTDGSSAASLIFSWRAGEPNDHGGGEDCAFAHPTRSADTKLMNDYRCDYVFNGLCEIPID